MTTASRPTVNSPGCSALRAMRIAEVVQSVDDLGRRQRLAAPQLERPGEDTRVGPLRFAVQARVDHPGEADIEIDANDRQDDEDTASADEETKFHSEASQPRVKGHAIASR